MNQKAMEIAGIILVVILILIPFGWIILSQNPAGSFTKDTSVQEIRDAMNRAGIVLCSERENTWIVPGAVGGMTYQIMKDCSVVDQRPDITIHVQKFVTEETRDAAIRGFNAQNRGKPNGVILTHGPYIILIQGSLHGTIAPQIKEQLERI